MSIFSNTAGAALCFLIVFVICVAALVDWRQARKERAELRLSDDLWRFPISYRALLKDCGAYMTDDAVQKYLKAIVKGYEDSRTLLRMGQVDRASKRFVYVQWCFHKARESAAAAAYNAETESLLLDEADVDFDEVASSNALLARRRAAKQ
ncbi:MAG: hypothetical protein P4L53_09210 [Candidatus Obscuribacterales bacterium]|nr:hypothetical protein [Candidatus Obscuribacterales bacterium]